MYVILFIVCVLGLGMFTAKMHGQSIGYMITGLRLVRLKDKRPATGLQLIMRQMLGFGIPMMILGFFFKTIGLFGWWIINGVVVLLTPHQQTIFDLVFGLVTVNDPEVDVQFKEEVQQLDESKQEVQQPVVHRTPIDLHIRSNYSNDGCYDVEELFKQAKENNMEVISITDHNCARVNAAAQR